MSLIMIDQFYHNNIKIYLELDWDFKYFVMYNYCSTSMAHVYIQYMVIKCIWHTYVHESLE